MIISRLLGLLISNFFFQKDKFLISNNVSKTRRFYKFILIDTESVQISHIKNSEDTDIVYSKCKNFKIISDDAFSTETGLELAGIA